MFEKIIDNFESEFGVKSDLDEYEMLKHRLERQLAIRMHGKVMGKIWDTNIRKHITITAAMGTAFISINGEILEHDNKRLNEFILNHPTISETYATLLGFAHWLNDNWDFAYHLDGKILFDRIDGVNRDFVRVA
jgi:hypothetical protein